MSVRAKPFQISAVYTFVYSAGAIVGPLAGGWGVQLTSFSVAMTGFGGVVLSYGLVYGWYLWRRGLDQGGKRSEGDLEYAHGLLGSSAEDADGERRP